MRQALAGSRNVPTVRLAMEVGIDQVVTMAQQIGLGGHIPNVPSVVLGTAETTPLDVTSAFATFATLGSHPAPRLVTRVLDSQGQVVWSQEPSSTSALDPAVAFIVTSMLKDVVNRGTATAVRAVDFAELLQENRHDQRCRRHLVRRFHTTRCWHNLAGL
jgi:penicillin-binding protein 1A